MISALKMGSDVNHFTVSLTVPGKVARQCPLPTMFEEKGEPKPTVEPGSFLVGLPAESLIPLGQAGSERLVGAASTSFSLSED